jgi:hypothetical protein
VTQERWTAIDSYLTGLLVPPDPALAPCRPTAAS